MNEFTIPNFQQVLADVYARACVDEAYRLLCLTDPRAAVAAVSDIILPPDFQFDFVEDKREMFYSFPLPPLLPPPLRGAREEKAIKDIIEWFCHCTQATGH